MSTSPRERPGLGGAARLVADKASSLVRLELALAAAELRKKAATLGVGLGLLAAAAILVLFGFGFGLATIAAVLATVVPTWLALLIVTAGVVVTAALLGFVGVDRVKKATPPVPEQAIAEAKLMTEALKNGKH
jgi:hypothetical protein